MRKSFLVAGTAAFALSTAAVAMAQTTPPPSVTVTASVSPSKAGTKSKPKAEKLKLAVKNDPASKTTASKITITFPSTLKLSTSGLDQCKASDNDIIKDVKAACKKSIAGTGTAAAQVNPFATTPAPLNFDVTAIVGSKELLFFLAQTQNGPVKALLHGKISGSKMTISIPTFLQMPAPNTYSALLGLTTTIGKTKGSHALISSVGCKSKKHPIGVQVNFVPNPNKPAADTAKGTGNAACS